MKNEKIADRIKKQVMDLMVSRGFIDETLRDGDVTVSSSHDFITVEINPSKSSTIQFKKVTQDEFENKVDADSYLFGETIVMDEPENLKTAIKGIIDDSVRKLLPVSDLKMMDQQKGSK
jgi:hypothetical protein